MARVIIIIIIIIITIILVITFMQGIYNYIPETKHASIVYICSVFTICATRNVISPVKYVSYFYIRYYYYYYYYYYCILHSAHHSTQRRSNEYILTLYRIPSRQVSARRPPTSSSQYIAPFSHTLCLCLRTYFHSLLAVHITGMHCQYASCMMTHEHTMCANRTMRTVAITTTETKHRGD